MPEQPTLAPVATEAVAITPEATGRPAPDYELATKIALLTQYPPEPTRTPSAPFNVAYDDPQLFDFYDEEHGWVVADKGVRTTTNGGMDWSPDTTALTLQSTSDGGVTWTSIYKARGSIDSISFTSLTNGWMTKGDTLFATHDSGVTWQAAYLDPSLILWGVDFIDSENGWVKWRTNNGEAEGGIWHTTDEGKTWLPATNPCPDLMPPGSFSFINPTTGWIMCGYGPGAGHQRKTLYRTDDGGENWRMISDTLMGPDIPGQLSFGGYVGDLSFVDEKHGWFGSGRGPDGGGALTTDGGVSWDYTSGFGTLAGRPWTFDFLSLEVGYTIELAYTSEPFDKLGSWHTYRLLKTTDAGANWTQVYPPLHSKPSP